jgi:molecular chaperone DnaK
VSEAYGIDFGTTNSVLARATPNGIETVKLDESMPVEWTGTGYDSVLPSVIAFDGDEPQFGWAAKTRFGDRLEAVKRLFATEDTVMVGGRELKVETAAAMFFRHIQQRAAAAGLLGRLDRAVVTIPANSRGQARYRTKLSAGLAGIEVAALINEPTAAAMAHARTIGRDQRILVFDWGGGTLDVTILQALDGAFIEQSSKGIQRLGGIDLDAAFEQAIKSSIRGSDGWRPAQLGQFRVALERAKIALSTQTSAQVPLPGGGFLEVTRQQFERAVAPLIERTREPVEVCLGESPGRIDHLVMVGGSSKLPAVRRFICELVGAEPSEGVDPMTAVAEGAAVAAGILQGTIDDLDFYVGTEHALGVVVHNDGSPPEGAFSVLIGRNTKYPARATDSYNPALDFQEAVDVKVIEGDPDKPLRHEDNVILKNWSVTLPAKRLVADAGFTITYEYDIDGILHVTATDERTGQVFMSEELSFGAAQDRSALSAIRGEVDRLMDLNTAATSSGPPPADGRVLSAASRLAVARARDKVAPFVSDAEAAQLDELVARLEQSGAAEEDECRARLEQALRVHAYLL